jgi:hypothetical protein
MHAMGVLERLGCKPRLARIGACGICLTIPCWQDQPRLSGVRGVSVCFHIAIPGLVLGYRWTVPRGRSTAFSVLDDIHVCDGDERSLCPERSKFGLSPSMRLDQSPVEYRYTRACAM